MKALEIKNYTAPRYDNMRKCDQRYYKFSADWAQPQSKQVCTAAIKAMNQRVAVVETTMDKQGWGTKADTGDLLAGLKSLLKSVKLGSDDMQNSFTCYQLERYVLRLWYRGTKEQRDLAAKPAKVSGPTEVTAPAKAKTKAKAKVAVKAKVSTKAPAPKSAPTTKEGAPILHEVEVEDPTTVGVIDVLASFLQDELTPDQKRSLVTGLIASLK